jgi:hypothetical protein
LKGQSVVELLIVFSALLFCIMAAIKTSAILQKEFRHDFVKPSTNTMDADLSFSKNAVVFKNHADAKKYKNKNPKAKILILGNVGVLYEN